MGLYHLLAQLITRSTFKTTAAFTTPLNRMLNGNLANQIIAACTPKAAMDSVNAVCPDFMLNAFLALSGVKSSLAFLVFADILKTHPNGK